MTISYGKDTARVRDSMVPVGVAGLMMSGFGLGMLVYDHFSTGSFWGWGMLAFILACLLASGWIATCYRVVVIDRKNRLVSVAYRGGYGFRNSHSMWARREQAWSLDNCSRLSAGRHFENRETGGGKVAIYSILLESEQGDVVPVYQHTSESLILKETSKLANFLELPHREDF